MLTLGFGLDVRHAVGISLLGVVTTSRADYGIYLPVLRRIQAEPSLALRLLVTGMHLLPRFGMTVEAIEADGLEVAERVATLSDSDDPRAIAESMARGTAGFAEVFARSRPDILVVLGDRFEMHAAAMAAVPFCIPLAHIAGGNELTLHALLDFFLIHGMIVQGDCEGDFFGAVALSPSGDQDDVLVDDDGECRRLGRRVAELAKRLA